MKFNIDKIKMLMKEVSDKANLPLNYSSFGPLSELINNTNPRVGIWVSKRYLYENVYKQCKKVEEEGGDKVNLNQTYVDRICQYIGYKSFSDWDHQGSNKQPNYLPLDARLLACAGYWISYVRSNVNNGDILCAPVRIFQQANEMRVEMRGSRRTFYGALRLKGFNLFALIDTGNDKELHLIFWIGLCLEPQVLKGVFSGISSAGHPIVGREVLVKVEQEELKWQKLNLNKEEDRKQLPPKLVTFFEKHEENSIKIDPLPTNCNWDDFA